MLRILDAIFLYQIWTFKQNEAVQIQGERGFYGSTIVRGKIQTFKKNQSGIKKTEPGLHRADE